MKFKYARTVAIIFFACGIGAVIWVGMNPGFP